MRNKKTRLQQLVAVGAAAVVLALGTAGPAAASGGQPMAAAGAKLSISGDRWCC